MSEVTQLLRVRKAGLASRGHPAWHWCPPAQTVRGRRSQSTVQMMAYDLGPKS